MGNWQSTALGDVFEFASGKPIVEDAAGQYPAYGAAGVICQSRDFMYSNALIIGRVGAYCGAVEYCPGPFWASDNTIVARTKPGFDTRFMHFCLTRLNLRRYAGGAAQPLMTQSVIKGIQVQVPSLATQRRIADILSLYENLCDNNRRRIMILEQMAHSLYREWFINFRFPGHEDVVMVESSLGVIPDGWETGTIRSMSELITRGISPTYDEGSEQLVINQKCIRDGRLNLAMARRHTSSVRPERMVRFGDVLINSTGVGTLGRVAQIYNTVTGCTVDSHVTIVRPAAGVTADYLGLTLLSLQAEFEQMGVGSTGQTELSRERIGGRSLICPPSALQEAFSSVVSPLRELAVLLEAKNVVLGQARDLLLPKLVSGELDVGAVEEELAVVGT